VMRIRNWLAGLLFVLASKLDPVDYGYVALQAANGRARAARDRALSAERELEELCAAVESTFGIDGAAVVDRVLLGDT